MTRSENNIRPQNCEISVYAAGLVSSVGVGTVVHAAAIRGGESNQGCLGGPMSGFNPVPFLSDRKMMKAVSSVDAIGLVAIEDLKASMQSKTNLATVEVSPWRTGLYVGAPSAFASDNENYLAAVTSSSNSSGDVSMSQFGQDCMSSRPNTLLIGLPNNVLCYGSVILGINGPNSNYTSGEMSGAPA